MYLNNKILIGKNDKNECGIITEKEGEDIKFLTMCNYVSNLSFKKIGIINHEQIHQQQKCFLL